MDRYLHKKLEQSPELKYIYEIFKIKLKWYLWTILIDNQHMIVD